jgi:hypothetical protein
MPPRCGGIGGRPDNAEPHSTSRNDTNRHRHHADAPSGTANVRAHRANTAAAFSLAPLGLPIEGVRVVGRRRSAQAKQAIESLVPAAARCGSPGQTIPLPDPAGPRNLAQGTGIRRRGQLRPRHPLTRGPLSNRPEGRSSQPGTEEPGVTARHVATAPTVPPESKPIAGSTLISDELGQP